MTKLSNHSIFEILTFRLLCNHTLGFLFNCYVVVKIMTGASHEAGAGPIELHRNGIWFYILHKSWVAFFFLINSRQN